MSSSRGPVLKTSVSCVSSACTWVRGSAHRACTLVPYITSCPFPTATLQRRWHIDPYSRTLRILKEPGPTSKYSHYYIKWQNQNPYMPFQIKQDSGIKVHVNNYMSSGRRHDLARVGKTKYKGGTPSST